MPTWLCCFWLCEATESGRRLVGSSSCAVFLVRSGLLCFHFVAYRVAVKVWKQLLHCPIADFWLRVSLELLKKFTKECNQLFCILSGEVLDQNATSETCQIFFAEVITAIGETSKIKKTLHSSLPANLYDLLLVHSLIT